MNFRAEINVMPHPELLDPQGKAVSHGLHNLGFTGIGEVRVGRHITLHLEANSEQEAQQLVDDACKKLLANAIMEGYTFSIEKI
ncbi:MAG: phosphoribosylformylglycinamidine synthase subunit PurS [Chitinophagales bacterium]